MGRAPNRSTKAVRDHRLDLVLLALGDVAAAPKPTFGGGRLGGEVVTQVSSLALDLPAGRQLEALLHAAVGLHLVLRHGEPGSISRSFVGARARDDGRSDLPRRLLGGRGILGGGRGGGGGGGGVWPGRAGGGPGRGWRGWRAWPVPRWAAAGRRLPPSAGGG